MGRERRGIHTCTHARTRSTHVKLCIPSGGAWSPSRGASSYCRQEGGGERAVCFVQDRHNVSLWC